MEDTTTTLGGQYWGEFTFRNDVVTIQKQLEIEKKSLFWYVTKHNTRMCELFRNYPGDYLAKRKKFNKIITKWNAWYKASMLLFPKSDEEIKALTTLWLERDSAAILDSNTSDDDMMRSEDEFRSFINKKQHSSSPHTGTDLFGETVPNRTPTLNRSHEYDTSSTTGRNAHSGGWRPRKSSRTSEQTLATVDWNVTSDKNRRLATPVRPTRFGLGSSTGPCSSRNFRFKQYGMHLESPELGSPQDMSEDSSPELQSVIRTAGRIKRQHSDEEEDNKEEDDNENFKKKFYLALENVTPELVKDVRSSLSLTKQTAMVTDLDREGFICESTFFKKVAGASPGEMGAHLSNVINISADRKNTSTMLRKLAKEAARDAAKKAIAGHTDTKKLWKAFGNHCELGRLCAEAEVCAIDVQIETLKQERISASRIVSKANRQRTFHALAGIWLDAVPGQANTILAAAGINEEYCSAQWKSTAKAIVLYFDREHIDPSVMTGLDLEQLMDPENDGLSLGEDSLMRRFQDMKVAHSVTGSQSEQRGNATNDNIIGANLTCVGSFTDRVPSGSMP